MRYQDPELVYGAPKDLFVLRFIENNATTLFSLSCYYVKREALPALAMTTQGTEPNTYACCRADLSGGLVLLCCELPDQPTRRK